MSRREESDGVNADGCILLLYWSYLSVFAHISVRSRSVRIAALKAAACPTYL